MKTQRRKIISFGLTAAVLLVGLVALYGCKKDEPVQTTPAEMVEAAKAVVAEAIEQKTCPIMGGAIDKKIFTEYKGQKVYFCCPGCKTKFEEDPEKYIAKLPQFK